MVGNQLPSSSDDLDALIGSGPEPIAVGVQRAADVPKPPGNTIVYCGSPELVGRGFVIALRAMGSDADLAETDIVLPRPSKKEH